MVWNSASRIGETGGVVFMASAKGMSVTVERDNIVIVAEIPKPLIPTLARFLIESGAKFGKVWSAQDERQLPPSP